MTSPKLVALVGSFVLTALLAGCGGGEPAGAKKPDPQQAFLQSMVPHHNSAVEMAEVAETEGESKFVKDLAGDITRTQTEEIGQMEKIHQRLFNAPLEPDMGAHSGLGLSAQQAGMDHMDGAEMIRGKEPFDRVFVDEMIPHHRGAIRMAEAVQAKTRDPELLKLAEGIVTAQEREISEMESFLKREYASGADEAAMANG